ncbi:GntR family transcriptional regulator [Parerythrobacter jejuensis]|uniref:GntR family transcriptional regulator n=1 Tax=Parerythrobacter jejuensis TaxID=795812 RepID=A0A845AQ98_9SPHN|nr:GntR family transcriptional regulator [Parerythrobacter jejuensis]MXP31051.1 GntR family transcriptional regulator [Parerythrobacter jejuensis]MXP33811.1 GntR family transcriptional regulator [Parerythrobacter jejuensis]
MNTSNRPVYLRLRDMIAAAIIDGRYREGEMLPSVRAFAAEQGANPLTVAKAYQQFQTDGLVEVQRGVGMYVVDGAADKLRQAERDSFLAEEWPEIMAKIVRLGIDPAQLLTKQPAETV